MTYPIFLNLRDAACLVAGAGAVGCRKVEGLLAGGAGRILVLDPALKVLPPEARRVLDNPAVAALPRAFAQADLKGMSLVFAATNDMRVNEHIARACAERCLPCNVATSLELSTFVVPSRLEVGGIRAALMTDGASPALSRHLRSELEEYLRVYAGMAQLLGRLRPLVTPDGQHAEEHAALFRNLIHSPLPESLNNGDRASAKTVLRENLPPRLHPRIEELLHDLV